MNNIAYKTMYKSVGMPEWRLIAAEARRAFHPRLLTKPIFYPALSYEYACKLAREWNTIDHMSEYTGLVVGFNVEPDFLCEYQQKLESAAEPGELWVDVESLCRFNQLIQGRITVYEVYYGEEYTGIKYTPQDLNEEAFLA